MINIEIRQFRLGVSSDRTVRKKSANIFVFFVFDLRKSPNNDEKTHWQ